MSKKIIKNRGSQKRSKSGQNKDHVECFKCHELGHFAHECPMKKGVKGGGGVSRDCALVVEKARKEKCESSESEITSDGKLRDLLNVGQKDSWIIDSGASRHVT